MCRPLTKVVDGVFGLTCWSFSNMESGAMED